MLSGFSREPVYILFALCMHAAYSQVPLKGWICLPLSTRTPFNRLFRQPAGLSLLRPHVAPASSNGILTVSSICFALRLIIRARLTLIRFYPDPINVDQETLVFRRGGFSPPLSLLIPTFAFPNTPTKVNLYLLRIWNAPLPLILSIHCFGKCFMPDYYPCPIPRLVSCYALFK